MKTCYIFGSLEVDSFNQKIEAEDLVIAADAGLKNAQKLNILPNYIVGDFDSLEYIPTGSNVIKHPVKKDETDTLLAVDTGLKKGYKNFIIYGCLGGRLDQTVASIQTASYIAEKGANAVFIDSETHLTVIKDSEIHFSKENKGIISVFACSDTAFKVTEKNLLFELDDTNLSPDYPLGVSNEFIDKEAFVAVKKGKLCIIWNGNHGNWEIGGSNG